MIQFFFPPHKKKIHQYLTQNVFGIQLSEIIELIVAEQHGYASYQGHEYYVYGVGFVVLTRCGNVFKTQNSTLQNGSDWRGERGG